ncbi:prolyl oligopeptidase family serine peptidase [Tanticharoenia sakaeratensis]|uniref:Prolyl oligopeptidase family protein n=1 Tax=Tanticharoenia sakaeratensis NBRC 103193 TaxID=1231623 RepID=A0A0D6MHJ3_9PROT|nr:prolyl oligopeptidase family serine peptidase [Tanticharoenia sakaeratensis]GAN52971.1 prolyl oligopeptidase family protein [Tanticharoenia sakaeratensis NBRC 103193]GBQ19898.1 prolyl oligopeptidase [Tanticharoenia sakaeratensis NBRC 103193]
MNRFSSSRVLCASVAALALSVAPARAATVTSPPYLDEITGARALDFVKARDAHTLDVLTHDPRYAGFYKDALTIAQSHDRIAAPEQLNGQIYNFWQDADHVRGIWRRTGVASYRTGKPDWTTVLDLDALSASEHANWVWKGADCLEPDETRCLISLSDGGEDAVTVREFDLATNAFVPGGFALPGAKQSADWLDRDTLLVSRPWRPGDLTDSSYPYIVRLWHRGTPLNVATEVARGTKQDMEASGESFTDGQGHHVALIQTAHTIFSSSYALLENGHTTPLDLPRKSDIQGLLDGQLVVRLNEPWTANGQTFPTGALVAVDPTQPAPKPELIAAAGPRQMIEGAAVTKGHVLVALYDNVRGTVVSYARGSDGWRGRRLALPGDVSVSITSSTIRDDDAFIGVSGFLTPPELWQANARTGGLNRLVAMPPQFDAAGLTVDQYEAASTDGTKIPYFLVHRRDMAENGTNPVQLYAYGGFQISMTPRYSGTLGKLWLDRGGVYALANIRGGGEFGPAWHEAGLNVHRQRVFDDFAAVARDMIARHVTSPAHLAIRGGSNGGLLMGVEFTQHPELWKAVVIEVPLLDMVNFETMSAGSSWTGEYGSVRDAAQRAFLEQISPLQNLKSGVRYPVPFIMTSTKDDRVGPVHARRFAARMDALHLPYFYDEQVEGGHAAGANLREAAQEAALEYTYMWRTLDGAP